MTKRYPKVEDHEWVPPVTEGYGTACCDCGLVHCMNFRIHEGPIQFQASQDNRATGQIRRKRETILWSTKEWIATPNYVAATEYDPDTVAMILEANAAPKLSPMTPEEAIEHVGSIAGDTSK